MKKQPEKKKRYTIIEAEFKANAREMSFQLIDDKLKITSENGEVLPTNFTASVAYDRVNPQKSPKIICQTKNTSYSMHLYDFIKSVDIVYAVDTNTKPIPDIGFVSIGVITKGIFTFKDDIRFTISYSVEPLTIKSINIEKHPDIERFVWKETIEYIKRQKGFENKHVALIVDSALNNIQQYNERKLPIISNYYLPEGFTLIYASSDVGKEYLPNQMIACCDKQANEIFSRQYP